MKAIMNDTSPQMIYDSIVNACVIENDSFIRYQCLFLDEKLLRQKIAACRPDLFCTSNPDKKRIYMNAIVHMEKAMKHCNIRFSAQNVSQVRMSDQDSARSNHLSIINNPDEEEKIPAHEEVKDTAQAYSKRKRTAVVREQIYQEDDEQWSLLSFEHAHKKNQRRKRCGQ